MRRTLPVLLGLALIVFPARAQWNPAAAAWGKSASTDVRVMTWNVKDGICSTNAKQNGANNWTAIARVIAALQPDILLLQETGDNSGNGTGGGVDSVANLTTTLDRLMKGGTDPFNANAAVTAYVQLWAPGYDLPHVFVSSDSDGFNRNVILSRWPFVDLNGDTKSKLIDIPTVTAHLWAPGGDGGIRGFMFGEIDLPSTYAGDLVVGNAHLKAGSAASDHTQRENAARNVAYYIDHLLNGAGTGIPDPFAKIADSPATATILPPNTSVILGGDWNEDETANGSVRGPADWLSKAEFAETTPSADGPDRNRGDIELCNATDVFTGSVNTLSSVRFDYIAHQGSITALRRAFVFNSNTVSNTAMPVQITGFSPTAQSTTSTGSDHRVVVADFILPMAHACNTAGVDVGFGKAASSGTFPRLSACGGLASGQSANLALNAAAGATQVWLGASTAASPVSIFDGTVVPNPLTIFGPFPTPTSGILSFPITGGGGPFTGYVQYAIADAGATFGVCFSNGLRLDMLP